MAVPIPTILKEIASKSKKDEKKEVLLKYANNGAFREILKYAFDPNIGVGDTINIELTNNAGTNDLNAFSIVRGDKVVITAFASCSTPLIILVLPWLLKFKSLTIKLG